MRGKSLFLLLLALGCGLVASIGITQVMARRGTDSQSLAPEMDKIVVAIKDLPMGDPINKEWVKLEDWPKDKVPPGAMPRLEDVEKRRPKTRVFSGSPVLENQLFGRGETDSSAGGTIPPGYRVVSIEVNSVSGAGGMLRPGDRVDLLLCVQNNPGKQIHEASTRIILQDVKVFAVNDRFRMEGEEGEKSIAVKTVSLLVTPEQAQRVTLATDLGSIRLALRSPEDQLQPKVAPSSPADLFGVADGAKRDNEAKSTRSSAGQGDKVDDFVKFLQGQKPQTTAAAAPREEPRSSFAMRIIAGAEVNDVRLELASDSGSEEAASLGFPIWKSAGPIQEPKVKVGEATLGAEPPPPPREQPTKGKKAKGPETKPGPKPETKIKAS